MAKFADIAAVLDLMENHRYLAAAELLQRQLTLAVWSFPFKNKFVHFVAVAKCKP